MGSLFHRNFGQRTLLILLDGLGVILSLFIALWVRFQAIPGGDPSQYFAPLRDWAVPIAAIYVLYAYLFGLYHRLWRHASAQDVVAVLEATGLATLTLLVADMLWATPRPLPLSVILLGGLLTFNLFVAIRYRERLVPSLQESWQKIRGRDAAELSDRQRVLIFGAGEAGQLLAWRFLNEKQGRRYQLVGLVDDDLGKQGMRVHGVPVLGDRHAIPQLAERHGVDLIVLAVYNISPEAFREILSICETTSAAIKVIPSFYEFIHVKQGSTFIRDVTAQDLLGRKPVEIDLEACAALLRDKVILVTGAAGSVGSELCRQIVSFSPRLLLMLDNNETGLYDLALELESAATAPSMKLIVGDVTHRLKLEALFSAHRPQIVFHAAAYKHVPLMEEHPDEAVRVNVGGTLVVAELSARHGVDRFVFISSDKAVDPSSVMGATKRLGELLIMHPQGLVTASRLKSTSSSPRTLFTAVRFGNVLGSRGSVLPTFEKQIALGGSVTVTHPEMTRYFLSISEAVSLIIQAAALTEGGDLFMLDMGERIRIDDLARRLIRLRGLRPEVDIPIEYTSPRPGEKLHEQLVGVGEERLPTLHPHISQVRGMKPMGWGKLSAEVDELISLAETQQKDKIVEKLHSIITKSDDIPERISAPSR